MQTRFLVPAVMLAAFALAGCSDDQCTFDTDCVAGNVCVSHACVPKSSIVTCEAGRAQCSNAGACESGVCEGGCCAPTCASKLDCADGEACINRVCTSETGEQGCASDDDCSGGTPRCHETSKICVACTANADCGGEDRECGADNRCRLKPGRCSQTTDCAVTPATPVCDTDAKRCVRCIQNLDCGSNSEARCVDHACVTAPDHCTWDSDCAGTPTTPRCDLGSGDCVECVRDNQCDATEKCNLTSHTCEPRPAGCESNTDCSSTPATPKCRVADRACVACLGATDCPGGRCLSNGTCGSASSCASNVDCSSPKGVCGAGGLCVECTESVQCGTGKRCSQGLCIAESTGCAIDGDCSGTTPKCRTSDRTCVGCLVRSDCGDLQACNQNRCSAGPCTSNPECARVDATKPICNPNGGACVECTQTSQCGQYEVCTANVCVLTGCGSDAECGGTTPKCRADRQCVTCLQESDCGPLKTCNGQNQCVAGPCESNAECASVDATKGICATSGSCVQCTADAQCPGTGKVCRTNRCVAAHCGSDADCDGTTPRCETGTGACVGCVTDSHCSAGQRCNASRTCETIPGLGQPCDGNGACPAGLDCITDGVDDTCRLPCDVYAPRCATGQVCTHVGWDGARPEGSCIPTDGGTGPGGVCARTTDCREDLVCVYDTANSGRCRAMCDPASTTGCASPNKCQPLVDLDDNNVPRSFGACFPDTTYLDGCGDDTACGTGLVCSVLPDPRAPTQLENICHWPTGTKTGIAGCDDGDECRSGLCVWSNPSNYNSGWDGHCQKACDDDADCPATPSRAGACASVRLPWYDESGNVAYHDVNTCVPQCTSELNCGGNDTCGVLPNATGTQWVTRCWPAPNDAGPLGGARCASDTDCWSGVCMKFGSNTTDGICQGVCDRSTGSGCHPDGECAPKGVLRKTPGADGVYGNTDDRDATAPLCWGKTCDQDSDCAGQSKDTTKPRVCMADRDPTDPTHKLLLSCKPRLGGAKNGGATCTSDSECGSGWCVPWQKPGTGGSTGVPSVTSMRCFAPCASANDCVSTAAAPTKCGPSIPASWSSRLGNDGVVNGCVPIW